MVIREDQERVRMLLKDTITLLCKNGLNFDSEFSVEAIIGITLDKRDVFLVSINESVQSEFALQKAAAQQSGLAGEESPDSVGSGDDQGNLSEHRRRRRRRKRRRSSFGNKTQSTSSDGAYDNGSGQEDSQSEPPSKKSSANIAKAIIVKKEENTGDSDDLVFVKQEIDKDHWSSCQQGEVSLQEMPSTSQDLDFLHDASLVPVGQSSADSFHSSGSMARTSTITSNYKGNQSQEEFKETEAVAYLPLDTLEQHIEVKTDDQTVVVFDYNMTIQDKGTPDSVLPKTKHILIENRSSAETKAAVIPSARLLRIKKMERQAQLKDGPHTCACGRVFQWKKSHTRHLKKCFVARGQDHQVYACGQCGQTYTNESSVYDHLMSVHGNAKWTCKKCGKEYRWRPSLFRHSKKCNGNSVDMGVC